MPLKLLITKLRENSRLAAYTYRIPLPVKDVLVFDSGNSYPVCPRCASTIDREYLCFCDRCGQRLAWKFYDLANVTVHSISSNLC